MSVHDVRFDGAVSWPSNGLSEVPFRVYTDPQQYAHRAGDDLQGRELELSLPRRRDPEPRRLGRDHGRRGRGRRGARRRRRDQCLRQPLRPSRQSLVPQEPRPQPRDHLHLSRLELRPHRAADRRRLREGRQAPGRHGARIPQGGAPSAASAGRGIVRASSSARSASTVADLQAYLGPVVVGGLRRVLEAARPTSSAARRRSCRTTGSSISRTSRTPTTPRSCTRS